MRDDRHALRRVGTNAPGVVKMMVRVDQVLNRLIRYELFHLGHYRRRTVVALRPFDDDQIILHFNQRAVMRAAGQIVNALTHLLGVDANRRRSDDSGRNSCKNCRVAPDFCRHLRAVESKSAVLLRMAEVCSR